MEREDEFNFLEPGKGAAWRAEESQQPVPHVALSLLSSAAISHPPDQLHHGEEGHQPRSRMVLAQKIFGVILMRLH